MLIYLQALPDGCIPKFRSVPFFETPFLLLFVWERPARPDIRDVLLKRRQCLFELFPAALDAGNVSTLRGLRQRPSLRDHTCRRLQGCLGGTLSIAEGLFETGHDQLLPRIADTATPPHINKILDYRRMPGKSAPFRGVCAIAFFLATAGSVDSPRFVPPPPWQVRKARASVRLPEQNGISDCCGAAGRGRRTVA